LIGHASSSTSVQGQASRPASGQEEDRHPQAVGGKPPLHLEPVQIGQHHVEHDQVRPKRRGRRQRAAATRCNLHLQALIAQRRRDQVSDALLVIDH